MFQSERLASLGVAARRRPNGLVSSILWVASLIAAVAALAVGAVLAVFTAAANALSGRPRMTSAARQRRKRLPSPSLLSSATAENAASAPGRALKPQPPQHALASSSYSAPAQPRFSPQP